MTASMPHIVCFAPYTDWSIHSARQVTLLHALRTRGASSTYVTCDAVFSDCDLFQEATGAAHGRQPNSCLICQASVASRLAAWDMPYQWLGTWLTTTDRDEVGAWLSQLSPNEYQNARFQNWDIGAWVKSSVRTHLRCNTLDMSDDNIAQTYASYLFSGALAALGLDRLFDDEKPDIQLLFNGRMAPTRIALEIAKEKGVRTLVEERSAVAGRMLLFEDVNCLDIDHVDRMWEKWKNRPLSENEVAELDTVLENRRTGGQGEVSVFSHGRQDKQTVRQQLGLNTEHPVWVLYTSSVDEIADKENIKSVFANQIDWVEATLSYAAAHPEIQLVIRVHPNVGGERALGENTDDVEYFRALENRTPSNVRIVQPGDSLSSYTLAELCDVALVWYSTIGVETAALGRRVVQTGGFLLENREFVFTPTSPETYSDLLDALRKPTSSEDFLDSAVAAWRFAYVWFLRRTFELPQVAQPEWYVGEPTWQSVEELAPGKSDALDHLCNIFLGSNDLMPNLNDTMDRDEEIERELIAARIKGFYSNGAAG